MTYNEQTIYIFALRYAMGRKTFAFNTVSNEILQKAKEFEPWQLKQMAKEILEDKFRVYTIGEQSEELVCEEYKDAAERLMGIADEIDRQGNTRGNQTGKEDKAACMGAL